MCGAVAVKERPQDGVDQFLASVGVQPLECPPRARLFSRQKFDHAVGAVALRDEQCDKRLARVHVDGGREVTMAAE